MSRLPRMRRLLLCFAALWSVSACATPPPAAPIVEVVKVKVPDPLLAPIDKPLVPTNADQRDVAVFILEQDMAIDVCNGQLAAIRWINEQ